jgi:hypothetical protein
VFAQSLAQSDLLDLKNLGHFCALVFGTSECLKDLKHPHFLNLFDVHRKSIYRPHRIFLAGAALNHFEK